jgi:hypothetical protein
MRRVHAGVVELGQSIARKFNLIQRPRHPIPGGLEGLIGHKGERKPARRQQAQCVAGQLNGGQRRGIGGEP